MFDNINVYGSKWLKFDFHTHTPKSTDYGRGDENIKNITPQEWLKNAMMAKLDCIVVTDHNSGQWIEDLKIANVEIQNSKNKYNWYHEITIFPGFELSVSESNSRIHLLAIFDPNKDSESITGILGGCGIVENYGNAEHATNQGFTTCVEKIKENNGIVIAAHCDCDNGLLFGMRTCTNDIKTSLASVVGLEYRNSDCIKNYDIELQKAVANIAKISGSDAHKPNEIGTQVTWVKMSKRTIDGLQLALMDHVYCIKNQEEDPNNVPELFLSKLSIDSMQHCGRRAGEPLVVEFNPHLNTIIGGRGTGKSTIIESIRIASRQDQTLGDELVQTKQFLHSFMRCTCENGVMLDNTEILLQLHRRGQKYKLRWRQDGTGNVLEIAENGIWHETEIGELKERFPIMVFSQKQINELASNPRSLLQIIDRSDDVKKADWEKIWNINSNKYFQLMSKKRDILYQLKDEEKICVQLNDILKDLNEYNEKGHGEILKKFQICTQQLNALQYKNIFNPLIDSVKNIACQVELFDFPNHIFDSNDKKTKEIIKIHENTARKLKNVSLQLYEIAKNIESIEKLNEEAIHLSEWYKDVINSFTVYDSLIKEYEKKNSDFRLDLYGEWIQNANYLTDKLKQFAELKKELKNIDDEIKKCFENFYSLRTILFEKRSNFINRILGNKFVRMKLIKYGDVSDIEKNYRRLLNIDENRFANQILDDEGKNGILSKLKNWEDHNLKEDDLPGIIEEIKLETRKIALGKEKSGNRQFDKRLMNALDSRSDFLDYLDIWWPEDKLQVQYSKDQNKIKFEDVEKGSAGQKAAAILAFLLSYGNEPLIIDQPEDDLDNALIYDLIVQQIHEIKNKRQLIIATHNPNIVVNGDAESILVLKYARGQIQKASHGGLEEKEIRTAICNIMEGGRRAFETRYKRITLGEKL